MGEEELDVDAGIPSPDATALQSESRTEGLLRNQNSDDLDSQMLVLKRGGDQRSKMETQDPSPSCGDHHHSSDALQGAFTRKAARWQWGDWSL